MPEFVELIAPTVLPKLMLRCDNAWKQARAVNKTNLIPNAATFKGLCEHSDIQVPDFFKGTRTRTPKFDVVWADACTNNPQYKTDAWVLGMPCDFSGWTVGTNKQEVMVKSYVDDAFYLPYDVFDNMIPREEMFEKAYLRMLKGLIEKLDQIAISKMQTYTGVNALQDTDFLGVNGGGTGANAWKTTLVPRANLYPESFNSYVAMLGRANKMESPSLYVGGALEMSEFVPGSLEKMKFGNLEVYSDLENFADLGISKDMFLISHGAIGVLNAWGNPSVPTPELDGMVQFSRALPPEYNVNGMPLMMDITRKRMHRTLVEDQYGAGLDVAGQCEIVEKFYFRISFEFALNPLACQELQTGVLKLRSDNTLQPFMSPMRLAQTFNYPIAQA